MNPYGLSNSSWPGSDSQYRLIVTTETPHPVIVVAEICLDNPCRLIAGFNQHELRRVPPTLAQLEVVRVLGSDDEIEILCIILNPRIPGPINT